MVNDPRSLLVKRLNKIKMSPSERPASSIVSGGEFNSRYRATFFNAKYLRSVLLRCLTFWPRSRINRNKLSSWRFLAGVKFDSRADLKKTAAKTAIVKHVPKSSTDIVSRAKGEAYVALSDCLNYNLSDNRASY